MTGLSYWRKKRHYSKKVLSEKAGVSIVFIAKLEQGFSPETSFILYIRLANALNVTVDQLLEEYDDAELGMGDHGTYRKTEEKHCSANCIAEYRREENLTYQELSLILGISSREGARRICNAPCSSKKHLKTLAAREKLSVAEFMVRYEPERRLAA